MKSYTVNGITFNMIKLKKGLALGQTPVTQELYQAVMDSNPSEHKNSKAPVTNVSYNHIVNDFIPKLNKLTGKVFRLPTENEWEYACRAGSTTSYWWGDDFDGSKCWHGGNSNNVMPVHEASNRWGFRDMLGNVWEWTSTAVGSSRVNRGGSWSDYAGNCRSALRNRNTPDLEYNDLGFRLSRSLPSLKTKTKPNKEVKDYIVKDLDRLDDKELRETYEFIRRMIAQ